MGYRNANTTLRSGSGSRSKRKKKRSTASTRPAPKKKRKRSSGRSAPRSRAAPKKKATKKAARLYTRYDPDSGVTARVANTDPRYDEWLTATQWRSASKARQKQRERNVEAAMKVTQAAAPALLPVAQRTVAAAQTAAATARRSVARVAATRIAVGAGGTATVGIGAAAGLAILAGVASYYGTTWVMGKLRQLTDPQEKAFQLATAYRKARTEAAQKLGRALTAEEVKYLGAELNAQLVKMGIRT
jgi:hypothetical protein